MIAGLVMVFILTIGVLAGGLVGGAKVLFTQQLHNRCMVVVGQTASIRPNCVSEPMKYWEGPWFTYAYNACGFRAARSCHGVPPARLRVALIGTSFAEGAYVPYPQTLGPLGERELTARCGEPVTVQSAALFGAGMFDRPLWRNILTKLPIALAQKPQAVVLVMSAQDLRYFRQAGDDDAESRPTSVSTERASGSWARLQNWLRYRYEVWQDDQAVKALRKAVFGRGDRYLGPYLAQGDSTAFMDRSPSPLWRMRAQIATETLQRLAHETRAAGVPLIVIYYPSYGQAVAARYAAAWPGLDPYALANRLRPAVQAAGAVFIDGTSAVSRRADLEGLYYVTWDHPTGAGYQLLADLMSDAVATGTGGFERCRTPAQ